MGKITETTQRYKETINEITKSEENWLSFLDSASWNFKYDFADQVLIYTQRPDATACADINTWNRKVKRWVNKNANGIFVLSKDENSPYPFRLVFDVSDTHNYKGTQYKLWEIKPEYEQEIIETLDSTFGAESEEKTLVEAIRQNAFNMVEDNLQDYIETIQKYKIGTSFEELEDENLINAVFPTVWASVSYMMMTRCGVDAKKEIEMNNFGSIKDFDNENIITILGQAISDIAEMGLREIAKTVKNLQIEEKNQNRTFVKNQKQEYSNNKKIEEGEIENGENRIHESERLQYTKSSDGERTDTRWQVRKNEVTLSKEREESRVPNLIDEQEIERTSNGNTGKSSENGQRDSGENSEARGNDRRIESQRPNEMDRTNEQLQSDGRGTSDEGNDLQLDLEKSQSIANELPTEDEQKHNIAEANASVFSFTQEMIDNILKKGSNIEDSKFRIYEYLTRGLSSKENADFLKQEYGIGGFNDNGRWVDYNSNGITLSENNVKQKLTWIQVEKQIRELISNNRYFNGLEKDEYYDWLDVNGVKNVNEELEKEIHDEDYEIAKRLHDFIKDYDLYAYMDSGAMENTDEENIEIIRADINEESNIKDYIDFLKSSYEDEDYDDELAVEARALLVELEKRLPYYEFNDGDIVYIGTEEYEIRTVNEERVVLIDTSFPLFTKEMAREEFDRKVKENPANDKLRTGKRLQDKIEDTHINEKEESNQLENEKFQEKQTLEQRLHKFLNEYDIYDEDEITIQEIEDALKDTQKVQEGIQYFYEILNSEDILDEFSIELQGFINELENFVNVQERPDIVEQEKDLKNEILKSNIKRKRRNKIEYFDLHPEIPQNERSNFKISDDNLGIGGQKEKYQRNIEAIRV